MKVNRLRDEGVNEEVIDSGKDEIAVLANALNTGFSAIAERDRERNQFLAVVTHELKTPVTSIQGFAMLLRDHHQDQAVVDRAIEIIVRQSWRLSRKIKHVYIAIQARLCAATLGSMAGPSIQSFL